MGEIRIVSDPHASESLKQFVTDQLDLYNVAVTGFSAYSPVNFFLRDEGDEVMGGLLAAIWGGSLFIRILWVSEVLRGRRSADWPAEDARLDLASALSSSRATYSPSSVLSCLFLLENDKKPMPI